MNCKPGDLAVVINAVVTHELIGKIVRVIRRVYDGEPNSIGGNFVNIEFAWLCEGKSIPTRTTDGTLHFVNSRAIEDRLLRPIRPDETPEQSIEAMKLLTQLPKETV